MVGPSAARLAAVRSAAAAAVPGVVDLAATLVQIPAPTGDEAARSAFVARWFAERGLPPRVDDLHDVVATVSGMDPNAPAVLLAAHLDTVFAKETPLPVRREGGRVHSPGIGDNCVGIAAVLSLPQILREAGLRPATDLLLTGNVGEEGLGNLRGIRAVLDAEPRVGAVVAVEGHVLGRVTHVAVGSRRYRITATGPGGHSWGDWGRPSALHALARLVADLDAIPLPRVPKTTLNVGMIEGGISVNSIAPSASCLVDLRSVDESSLARLSERVLRVVDGAGRDGIAFEREELGIRPAGVVPLAQPIVRIAAETLASLGIDASFDASSTDANIPISRGIPSLCVGLTTGGNVHREDEYINVAPLADGIAQLAILALGIADALAAGALTADAR